MLGGEALAWVRLRGSLEARGSRPRGETRAAYLPLDPTPLPEPAADGPLLFKPGCVKLSAPLTGSDSATTTPWAALSGAGMRCHGLPCPGPSSPLTRHRQLP